MNLGLPSFVVYSLNFVRISVNHHLIKQLEHFLHITANPCRWIKDPNIASNISGEVKHLTYSLHHKSKLNWLSHFLRKHEFQCNNLQRIKLFHYRKIATSIRPKKRTLNMSHPKNEWCTLNLEEGSIYVCIYSSVILPNSII